MEAVHKTPEREAFYRKIDGENLSLQAAASILLPNDGPHWKAAHAAPSLTKYEPLRRRA